MADKKDAKSAEKPAEAEAPKKKGLPIKTIGIVAGVMIVEAIAVVTVFKVISPKTSHAAEHAEIQNNDGDTPKELKVVDDRFQNMRNTESWMWQISVAVKVKKRHADKVESILKSREAEVKDGIRKIVGTADHNQLKEPKSETLTRQISAFLNTIVPVDEKTSEPLIESVLIPRCFGVAAE
jgi:flagellar basal body-associated protein FliL